MKRVLFLFFASLLSLTTWAAVKVTVIAVPNDDGVTIYYELSAVKGDNSAFVTYDTSNTSYNSYSGDVVIPSSVEDSGITYDVTGVNANAFYLSTGLTSVTLPESTTYVQVNAFGGCTSLQSITVLATDAPYCYDGAFNDLDTDACVLYVPEGCVDAYAEADGWKEFTKIKVIGDEEDEGTPLEDGTVFEYEGLNYQVVSSESKTIETTYSGEKNTTATTYAGDIEIPAEVTYEGVTYTVVGVGDYTFYNAKTAITTVSIPETVTRIGSRAFYYCNTIPQLTLPSGLTTIDDYAFYYCNKITTFNIPSTVTYIGAHAFRNCSALTSMELPDGLTEMSEYLFYGCTALKTVKVPDTVTSLADYVFYQCSSLEGFDFPSGVTSLGANLFYQCKAITSMELPSGVTSLPKNFCYQCTALENVVLSEKTVNTGENAFYGCTALKKVTYKDAPGSDLVLQLPECCTTIGHASFRQCGFEGELIVPATVTSLGVEAFYNCTSITSVTIEANSTPLLIVPVTGSQNAPFYHCTSLETVKLYRDCYNSSSLTGTTHNYGIFRDVYAASAKGTLNNVYFGGELTEVPQYGFYADQLINNVVFEEGNKVTSIGYYAFYQCKGITSVAIPDGVKLIDGYAFYQNTALEEIAFGEESALATINNYALYGNTALTELVLPATLQNVGGNAFNNCTKLLSVTSLNPTPPTCDGVNTFSSTTTSTGVLYVPCGSEDDYAEIDDWCDFTTIVGIDCQDEPLEDGDTFEYDGLYYRVVSTEKMTVYVTYGGEKGEATESYMGEISIPETAIYEDGSIYDTYSVIGIDEYAFYACTNLTSITMLEAISHIGDYAFDGCVGLTEVIVPNSVTNENEDFGSYVFQNCTGLVSATLPNNLEIIPGYTFANCTSLASITIPETVTTIRTNAFDSCYGLTEITIPESVTRLQGSAFRYCTGLTEVTIPKNLVTLDTYAFAYCSGITKVEILSDITTVTAYLFKGCSSLVDIEIPSTVKTIDTQAFYECTSLTEITIPESVTQINKQAFQYCSKLVAVYSLSTTPPTISATTAFEYIADGCVLYVPVGAYEDYYYTTWGDIFFNIVEMTEFSIETLEATDVTDTSATLNGSVTAAYNDPVTEKGFEYWTGNEEALKAVVEGDEMTATVTGLAYSTEYTYRAYVIMESGTTEYGEEQTFTTETPTGINGIHISIDDENVEGIYSTSGQKLNTTVKGVNIVRYSDGTVKKIYVK